MSLRIGGNIPSLYNATRINQAPEIDKTSRVEQKEAAGSQLQESREARQTAPAFWWLRQAVEAVQA